MSSAILYLAIVAIWAVVLVPRWLRPRSAPPAPAPAESDADARQPAGPGQDANRREPAGPGQDGGPELTVSAEGRDTAGDPAAAERAAGADAEDEGVAGKPDGQGADAPFPRTRRAQMLKARRRLLTALVALTVIAAALAAARIDAYWIVTPPAALLAGYLLLLRQFAHIDAGRARRTDADARADRAPTASREPAPAAQPSASEPGRGSSPDTPGPPAGAEIIDISGRIGDQVYDQYADAASRAVGD